MPTIGTDCDLMLVHPQVYAGDPFGFVLTPDPSHKTSSISIQRELALDGTVTVYIFFTVCLADDLHNPDGSEHAESRADMYAKLLDFLAQTEGISVITVMGTWLGIGPLGHSATELHLVNGSYISVKLANITAYHSPVPAALVLGSLWQDDPPEDDAFTWETSIWR